MISEYHMYYVEFPTNIIKTDPEFLCKNDAEKAIVYLQENHIDIYQSLKHGDFIENGTISDYRSNGVYIIDKSENIIKIIDLAHSPDEYGTIPTKFVCFGDNELNKNLYPNYNHEVVKDELCKSWWHNYYYPIDMKFIRSHEFKIKKINNFEFTYCEFISNNNNYLVIHLSSNDEENYQVGRYFYTTRDILFISMFF